MPVCPKCQEQNPVLGAKCPRDGYYYVYDEALEESQSDPLIGTLAAGKYVILGLISEGGMGAVYRALQLPVEREVAFKVLRAELKDSDKGKDRFIREARAVSRLSHPNIITLHDFGFENNTQPYMVMEYAPGIPLAKWLNSEEISLERILHVTRQILSALTDAHKQGIVHRDLKPDNMIVMTTGSDPDFIKLLDFGIARLINENATRGLTREGEVFGTPHYMAPEQAQGKKDVGPPADVYAVGIMLYEMLCGDAPFDAPTPLSVLYMHINDPLPELVPRPEVEIPPELTAIVRRAAAKQPQDRFQNAAEMLTELNALFEGHSSAFAAITGERLRPVNPYASQAAPTPTMKVEDPGADVPKQATITASHESDASFGSGTKTAVYATSVVGVLLLLLVLFFLITGAGEGSIDDAPAAAEIIEPTPAAQVVLEADKKADEEIDEVAVDFYFDDEEPPEPAPAEPTLVAAEPAQQQKVEPTSPQQATTRTRLPRTEETAQAKPEPESEPEPSKPIEEPRAFQRPRTAPTEPASQDNMIFNRPGTMKK